MSINLALILTLLTFFTGIIILLDKLVWRTGNKKRVSISLLTLIEYSRSFFPVLLFVLVIRSFIFEPFRIPSGSMNPTLLDGDFIFVTKYAYGLRLPVTEAKVIETGSPERGDVIVFRKPQDVSINFIKRVVGLPGDVIRFQQHRLTINGELVQLEEHPRADAAEQRYLETLGERLHEIQIMNGRSTGDGEYVVPEGHFFVMGDNRDNSSDSRVIGFIPETHLVGEAVRIWMHMDGFSWPRWERIGDKIQ